MMINIVIWIGVYHLVVVYIRPIVLANSESLIDVYQLLTFVVLALRLIIGQRSNSYSTKSSALL